MIIGPCDVGVKHEGTRMGVNLRMASSCFTRPRPYQPEPHANGYCWTIHVRAMHPEAILHPQSIRYTGSLREGRSSPLQYSSRGRFFCRGEGSGRLERPRKPYGFRIPHPHETRPARTIRGRYGLVEPGSGDASGSHPSNAIDPPYRIPPRGKVIAPTILLPRTILL
jgi:hypothetical protein